MNIQEILMLLGGLFSGAAGTLFVMRKHILPHLESLAFLTKTKRDDDLVKAVGIAIDTAYSFLEDQQGLWSFSELDAEEEETESEDISLEEAHEIAVAKVMGTYEEVDSE